MLQELIPSVSVPFITPPKKRDGVAGDFYFKIPDTALGRVIEDKTDPGKNALPDKIAANIVSIQTVAITIAASSTSNTGTISSVTTANSAVFYAGFTYSGTATALREILPRLELTNSTTVTAYRDTSSADTITVRGTVLEFDSTMATVQHGTVVIAASTSSNTATISSVTTSRSAVLYLGLTVSTTTTSVAASSARLTLTNATTVTANRNGSSSAVLTVGFCVIEFASGVTNSVQPRSVSLSTANTSDSDTITSVTTSRTLLFYNGATSGSTSLATFAYNLELTGATTVTLTRTSTNSTARVINYTAVEFTSGYVTSLERDTTLISGATSADATITTVNTSLALCNFTGFSTDGTSHDRRFSTVKLLNSTTVRCEKNTSTNDSTPGWEVIVFVAGGSTTTITPPAGTLAFTTQASTQGDRFAVPTGSLTISAQTLRLLDHWTVPAGTLALTGEVPTPFQSTAYPIPAGTLALSALAPTLLGILASPAGALSLTGNSPGLLANFAIVSASMVLAAEAVVFTDTVKPASGILTLFAETPIASLGVNVPAGELDLTGNASTQLDVFKLNNAALTLTQFTPNISLPFYVERAPNKTFQGSEITGGLSVYTEIQPSKTWNGSEIGD